MTNRFVKALNRKNNDTPPIWLMRQAGRYHSHYMGYRKEHGFLDICKKPQIACEVTMGPIDEFDFDAAIVFSDILFPIEQMGIDLKFDPGPQFGQYLKHIDDLNHYKEGAQLAHGMTYQADALNKIRTALPASKGLIGFVGGLMTLYIFTVEGSHKRGLDSAHAGLIDGRFDGFMEKMIPLLAENMVLQAQTNPDCLAILDSAAGSVDPHFYTHNYRPYLDRLIALFRKKCPDTKLLYYAKNITINTWQTLGDLDVQAFGIDHGLHMPTLFDMFGDTHALQGNIPPETMSMEEDDAQRKIADFLSMMQNDVSAKHRQGWICGLGHGILPTAHEANVHHFVRMLREKF